MQTDGPLKEMAVMSNAGGLKLKQSTWSCTKMKLFLLTNGYESSTCSFHCLRNESNTDWNCIASCKTRNFAATEAVT